MLTVSGAVIGVPTGSFCSEWQISHHQVGGEGKGWLAVLHPACTLCQLSHYHCACDVCAADVYDVALSPPQRVIVHTIPTDFCERRPGPCSALDKLFSPPCDLHVLICCADFASTNNNTHVRPHKSPYGEGGSARAPAPLTPQSPEGHVLPHWNGNTQRRCESPPLPPPHPPMFVSPSAPDTPWPFQEYYTLKTTILLHYGPQPSGWVLDQHHHGKGHSHNMAQQSAPWGRLQPEGCTPTRLATGVRQVRRDRQELDPTDSDIGCSWFLLSSRCDQDRYY